MSTRTRDSAPGKEKRGTSPSNIGTGAATQRRRSPNPSKTISPVRSPDSAPSGGKSIPNYLKPTASSATTDAPKQQWKKPVFSADSKPTVTRRRSFDKPPSPSRALLSSRISPSPALRSSSFSGKTSTSSQKGGAPEKNLKGPKDAGKQHSLYARPANTVKKTGVSTKKPEHGTGSSRKERVSSSPGKVDNPITHDAPDPEPQSDDHESFVGEEQTVGDGSDNDKKSEDPVVEDQEPMNINEQTEGESDDKDAEIVNTESPAVVEQHDADIVVVESPTVLENEDDGKIKNVETTTVEENQDAHVGVETGELEEKSREEQISSQQEEIKEETTDEMNDTNTDDSVAGNPVEEVEGKEGKQEGDEDEEEKEETTELDKKEEEEEKTALDKKEEVDSGSESHESKEQQEVQEAAAEEKNEAENTNAQVAHGKKDAALSNNVIEETASKLREQRQNKVKALAGAFESVMSFQEPK